MKKFFSLTKKKKRLSGTPDSSSVLSGGYELKDKDLGKVHKAAAGGDVGKLKELAEKHDINQLDKENRTALHIACASGHVEVVHFLLERKARLNLCDNQNRSALMKAVQCQHERCVRILLENHADPNLVDVDDNTALHLAANIPSISTAVLLLEHDADIDAQNKDGFTPLTLAVREDHIEMAEFLLREGADVNIVDKDQRSPLMIAAGNGLVGMLRLLLQFNAEVTLKDTKGWSADDYAVMNGYHPCSLLINEHSIKKNNGQSPSLPGLSKEKKPSPLGSPSQNAGAAVCLGGPATSKYDSEDNSQSESQSRDMESVCDDWPSSEDDSLLTEAKPQKANLMKMLASKMKEVPALPDRTVKDTKTDPYHENNVQNTIFLPKEHPVDPSPSFLPSKVPQLTPISPSNCKKSCKEHLEMSEEDNHDGDEISSDEEEIKEDMFYVPSFLRGEGVNRMAMLEPWRRIGMPRGSQGEVGNKNNDGECQQVDLDEDLPEVQREKPKFGLTSVLGKLEGDKDRKLDLMEELGLSGVDDFDDESDWDSDSASSQRNSPGQRMASPGLEEQNCSRSSVKEQVEDDCSDAPVLPQRSIVARESSKSPPPIPCPQPSARKMVLQKKEAVKGSPEQLSSPIHGQINVASDKEQQRVGKEKTDSSVEKQNCSNSWDSASLAEEEQAKPEALLECLSSQSKQQPTPTKRVPGQQPKTGTKEEKQAQLSPVTPHHRAPQQNTHIEDPLSLYDDGSLDGTSDEEGRLSANGGETHENPEHVEMAEDFADLSHSSDSSTDDMESPLSERTALFIQKLNSTLDSNIIIELQNIIYKYNRSIQKEKYRSANLANKVSYLEMEKTELKSSLEEVKCDRTGLELNQLELQAEVRNLKLQLKREHEDHSNATREKLRVMEEQQQFEVQEREKVEFTLRNLELENSKLGNNLKQLEEDYNDIQKLLAQERSARIQQENLFNNCLRKQQETEEENKQNISKSNEALTRLTEASSREREMLLQIATLQEQLTTSKRDLEHSHAHSSLREGTLLEENRTLKGQLEDARRDLKLNSESLKNTVSSSNNEVATLRSELTETRTRLENERHTREKLETELESIRNRLSGAEKEAERSHVAKSERESTLLREKEEHQHLKGKLTGEVSILREENNNLSQKLIKAEAQANNLENEVHRVSQQLKDKVLLQEVLQREKDQALTRGLELEKTLHAEREQFSRDRARHEATQERLTQAQSEVMLLRQQLEEAQNKGLAKERAVTDAQGHLKDILSKLQSDYEERVELIKERNKELDSKAADLQGHIHKMQEEKNEMKACLREAQQELADSLKKLSMSEASLEVNTRYRNDLEEEKARLFKDLDRLKRKLEESEEQYTQAERRIQTLTCSLDEREKERSSAVQKLQASLSTSAAYETTIKQLEQDMQRLEIENARLEATANKQSKEINTLQKGTHEAALLSDGSSEEGVRNHLEDLVAKLTFEDQLSKEVQKQSTQSHTAKDTQVLWEQEMKSRTQLGLRLAELEKQKGELSSQMEAEKNKAIQLEEQRKAIDMRLDLELKRNTELQKEMYRLRTLLKTAKKKLKDQDRSGIGFGSSGPVSNKVDRMQLQLEQEVSLRRQLEKVNEELKDQLASVKSTSSKKDQLEMRKKQLDEEVELFCRDAEERARQELQEKLDQVNLFLQSQAASQEVLEQKKANKEANLRFQLEQRIDELEGELRRARDSHRSTRTELERYQKLYTDELQLHKSLTDKLERATYQLKESNATLLNERNKSFSSGILDLDSLGSLRYGDTKGQLGRGVSLGLPLLSPVTERQSSRVGDYISKMQNELERSISNEIKNATAELESASTRLSPVGSVSRTDLHPVSMATQQYLEVLKKNNMI